MTNVDSQRIKEIRDNTRTMAEAFGRIADALAEALELYVSTQTKTQNSNLTFEKDEPQTCEECDHWNDTEDGCADRHGCKTEPSGDWICDTCKYHTIERAVQCKMCGDGGQYEPQTDCDGCQHYADKQTADTCYECKRSYTDCYVPL